jgi:hypothetical protein
LISRDVAAPLDDDAETPLSEGWVVADLDGDGTDEVVAGSDVCTRGGCG